MPTQASSEKKKNPEYFGNNKSAILIDIWKK